MFADRQKPLIQFDWPCRVYIEDTDDGGIVFYANYLKFMERARTEHLRSLGFDKNYIFNEDTVFVVHSMQVDYKKPALLDQLLNVEAHIKQLKRTSIVFRQNVYCDQQLLCSAKLKIACVAVDTLKPTAMGKIIYNDLYQKIHAAAEP